MGLHEELGLVLAAWMLLSGRETSCATVIKSQRTRCGLPLPSNFPTFLLLGSLISNFYMIFCQMRLKLFRRDPILTSVGVHINVS